MPTLIPHSQAESEHLNFTHLLTFLTAYQSPKYFPVLPAPLLSHSPPHNGTFGFGVFFHIRNYFSSVTLKTVLEAFSLYCSFWAGLGLDFFFSSLFGFLTWVKNKIWVFRWVQVVPWHQSFLSPALPAPGLKPQMCWARSPHPHQPLQIMRNNSKHIYIHI